MALAMGLMQMALGARGGSWVMNLTMAVFRQGRGGKTISSVCKFLAISIFRVYTAELQSA